MRKHDKNIETDVQETRWGFPPWWVWRRRWCQLLIMYASIAF